MKYRTIFINISLSLSKDKKTKTEPVIDGAAGIHIDTFPGAAEGWLLQLQAHEWPAWGKAVVFCLSEAPDTLPLRPVELLCKVKQPLSV